MRYARCACSIVLITLLALLTACGSQPAPQAQPTAPAVAASPQAAATTAAAPPTTVATSTGAQQTLRLATTTSTADSGLLDGILPDFEQQYNAKVQVVAVGTGQALKLGANGDADVVLVHARKQEDAFVAAGDGINRRDVM